MANSHSIGSQCSAEDDSRGVLGVRAGACAAGKTRGSILSNDGDCVHALEEIRAQINRCERTLGKGRDRNIGDAAHSSGE